MVKKSIQDKIREQAEREKLKKDAEQKALTLVLYYDAKRMTGVEDTFTRDFMELNDAISDVERNSN
jgi:hypothetical protein